MESLVVDQEALADAVLVRVQGDVDSISAGELNSQLAVALGAGCHTSGRPLVIDLQSVTFFGSAGLNAIFDCREKALAAGTSVLLVVADNEYVLRPLEVTKLDRVFEVHRTLTDALGNIDRQERE